MNHIILVIDDKISNFHQVENSLKGIKNIKLIYINGYDDFFQKINLFEGKKLIIIQDYFLEKGKTAVNLINDFKKNYPNIYMGAIYIGFSSIENASKRISEMTGGYFLKKNKENNYNIDHSLRDIISKIINNI